MNKQQLKKGIVFGLLLCLIGASVIPSITGEEFRTGSDDEVDPITEEEKQGAYSKETPGDRLYLEGQPPVADFTYFPTDPQKMKLVHFTDTSTDDGSIVSWYWDFDDGYSSYLQNPVHYYFEDGTYNVSLTVEDDEGLNDTIIKTIIVYTPPNSPPYKPPRPFGPRWGRTGKYVAFVTRAIDPEEDMLFYKWDWGDGNVSHWIGVYSSGIGAGRMYMYLRPGTYFVRVKAKDIHGAESPWSNMQRILIGGVSLEDGDGSKVGLWSQTGDLGGDCFIKELSGNVFTVQSYDESSVLHSITHPSLMEQWKIIHDEVSVDFTHDEGMYLTGSPSKAFQALYPKSITATTYSVEITCGILNSPTEIGICFDYTDTDDYSVIALSYDQHEYPRIAYWTMQNGERVVDQELYYPLQPYTDYALKLKMDHTNEVCDIYIDGTLEWTVDV